MKRQQVTHWEEKFAIHKSDTALQITYKETKHLITIMDKIFEQAFHKCGYLNDQ